MHRTPLRQSAERSLFGGRTLDEEEMRRAAFAGAVASILGGPTETPSRGRRKERGVASTPVRKGSRRTDRRRARNGHEEVASPKSVGRSRSRTVSSGSRKEEKKKRPKRSKSGRKVDDIEEGKEIHRNSDDFKLQTLSSVPLVSPTLKKSPSKPKTSTNTPIVRPATASGTQRSSVGAVRDVAESIRRVRARAEREGDDVVARAVLDEGGVGAWVRAASFAPKLAEKFAEKLGEEEGFSLGSPAQLEHSKAELRLMTAKVEDLELRLSVAERRKVAAERAAARAEEGRVAAEEARAEAERARADGSAVAFRVLEEKMRVSAIEHRKAMETRIREQQMLLEQRWNEMKQRLDAKHAEEVKRWEEDAKLQEKEISRLKQQLELASAPRTPPRVLHASVQVSPGTPPRPPARPTPASPLHRAAVAASAAADAAEEAARPPASDVPETLLLSSTSDADEVEIARRHVDEAERDAAALRSAVKSLARRLRQVAADAIALREHKKDDALPTTSFSSSPISLQQRLVAEAAAASGARLQVARLQEAARQAEDTKAANEANLQTIKSLREKLSDAMAATERVRKSAALSAEAARRKLDDAESRRRKEVAAASSAAAAAEERLALLRTRAQATIQRTREDAAREAAASAIRVVVVAPSVRLSLHFHDHETPTLVETKASYPPSRIAAILREHVLSKFASLTIDPSDKKSSSSTGPSPEWVDQLVSDLEAGVNDQVHSLFEKKPPSSTS